MPAWWFHKLHQAHKSTSFLTCCLALLCKYTVQEQVALARYSHLPVGNMAGDWVLNTADALFARCLRDSDHLLWVNDPSLPDVAGPASAPEDARFLLEQPVMEVSNVFCTTQQNGLRQGCNL